MVQQYPPEQAERHDELRAWLEARRTAIRPWVRERYSMGGVWSLYRRFFFRDLAVNVINSLVAVPLLAPMKVVQWLDRIGLKAAEGLPAKIPSGLPTRVQRELQESLLREIFAGGGPFPKGSRLEHRFRKILQEEVRELSRERAALADLLSSVVPIGAGYLFFRNTAVTASDIGRRVATLVSHKHAVSNFFLGESLGTVFYRWFPHRPTHNQILAATAVVLVLFAATAIVVNILLDPLRNRLGVHERRLQRLLDTLEMRALVEVHRGGCDRSVSNP